MASDQCQEGYYNVEFDSRNFIVYIGTSLDAKATHNVENQWMKWTRPSDSREAYMWNPSTFNDYLVRCDDNETGGIWYGEPSWTEDSDSWKKRLSGGHSAPLLTLEKLKEIFHLPGTTFTCKDASKKKALEITLIDKKGNAALEITLIDKKGNAFPKDAHSDELGFKRFSSSSSAFEAGSRVESHDGQLWIFDPQQPWELLYTCEDSSSSGDSGALGSPPPRLNNNVQADSTQSKPNGDPPAVDVQAQTNPSSPQSKPNRDPSAVDVQAQTNPSPTQSQSSSSSQSNLSSTQSPSSGSSPSWCGWTALAVGVVATGGLVALLYKFRRKIAGHCFRPSKTGVRRRNDSSSSPGSSSTPSESDEQDNNNSPERIGLQDRLIRQYRPDVSSNSSESDEERNGPDFVDIL